MTDEYKENAFAAKLLDQLEAKNNRIVDLEKQNQAMKLALNAINGLVDRDLRAR